MHFGLQNILFSLERVARARFEVPSEPDPNRHVVLASFPKSGNTWMRFVLANVNALASGDGAVDFRTVDRYSPAIRGNRRLEGVCVADGNPIFLKTHFAFVQGFTDIPSVVIVRNPFKAVPSYLNYMQRQHGKRFSGEDGFFFHWRYGFNAWSNFMLSWKSRATIALRYEDVQLDPVGGLSQMYRALGHEIDDGLLQEAIELSTRDRMKRVLSEFGDPHNPNGFEFVRKEGENSGIDGSMKRRILKDGRLAPHFVDQARQYGYL